MKWKKVDSEMEDLEVKLSIPSPLLRFLHYIVLFPILVFTSTSRWAILVHRYLFISFNYYLLLTQV